MADEMKYPLKDWQKGYYVAMPNGIILKSKTWRKLKPDARVIFQVMATKFDRWNEDGYIVEWSYKDLEEATKIPMTTMRRGIKELKKHGLIRVEQPGGRYYAETEYALNPYYLTGTRYSEWRRK